MPTPAWVALKVFTVLAADLRASRDWNGAVGICLKALRDNASITFLGDSAIVALSGVMLGNVA
ncbi:hypothetical protein [Kamptonema formosum]|uniref:hypothetical protein n=1 Tax=Kamptonema formosum TaxID=331992 RepID=UPI0003494823|nr:hypothetical protein [Oscillatoria sp. PCC 10802]